MTAITSAIVTALMVVGFLVLLAVSFTLTNILAELQEIKALLAQIRDQGRRR